MQRKQLTIGGFHLKHEISDEGFSEKDILIGSNTRVITCNIPDGSLIHLAYNACLIFKGKIGNKVRFVDIGFSKGKATVQFLKPLGKDVTLIGNEESYFVFAEKPGESTVEMMNHLGLNKNYHVMSKNEKETIKKKIAKLEEQRKERTKRPAKQEIEKPSPIRTRIVDTKKEEDTPDTFLREKELWERKYNATLAALGYNMSLPYPVAPRHHLNDNNNDNQNDNNAPAAAPRPRPSLPPRPAATDSPLVQRSAPKSSYRVASLPRQIKPISIEDTEQRSPSAPPQQQLGNMGQGKFFDIEHNESIVSPDISEYTPEMQAYLAMINSQEISLEVLLEAIRDTQTYNNLSSKHINGQIPLIPIQFFGNRANLADVIEQQYRVHPYHRHPHLMFMIKPDTQAYNEIRAIALAEAKSLELQRLG